MQIKTLSDANEALRQFVPPNIKGGYTLERMHKIMHILGNPQNQLNIIHVAGTSGKSSTCYYIAEMLRASGKKVGMTVSPHIEQVNERIQINGKPLDEMKFCNLLEKFLEFEEIVNLKPTYFEVLIAFAFWVFKKESVDYAVIEVGLGGLLDSTNVIESEAKTCVITDIGFDHTTILGNTLSEIAAQKAGIIQKNNQTFIHKQSPEIMNAVKSRVDKAKAKLRVVEPPAIAASAQPVFQQRNWHLAKQVYEFIVRRDQLESLDEFELQKTRSIKIPARMEVVRLKDKVLVLDNAHNPQKMHALVTSFQAMFPEQKAAVLISLLRSKEAKLEGNMQEISKVAAHITITSFDTQQDIIKKSNSPEVIAVTCQRLGFNDVDIIDNPAHAFENLLSRPEHILMVVGSSYLMHQLRSDMSSYKNYLNK